MFKSIQEQIYYLYHEKRQPLLLAIDEAQYLSQGISNDIKMLMNYGYDSINCFTLILCGEPHLNSLLRKPVNEALRQRITVHYNYEGLTDEESAQYLLHKIESAGGSKTIIEESLVLKVPEAVIIHSLISYHKVILCFGISLRTACRFLR